MLSESGLKQAICSARAAVDHTGNRHSVVVFSGENCYEVLPTVEAVKKQARHELKIVQNVMRGL